MKNQTSQTLAALLLFAVAMASRLVTAFGSSTPGWMQNFSPLAAICLCGAIYLSRKTAVVLPISIIFISDLILNTYRYHTSIFCVEMLSRYIAFAPVIALGWACRKHAKLSVVLPASLLGSILFYIITNTGSWISEPAYPKNLAGFLQAQTVGIPNQPATWTFFRSSAVSDLLFTTLFVFCMSVTASRTSVEKEAGYAHQPAV